MHELRDHRRSVGRLIWRPGTVPLADGGHLACATAGPDLGETILLLRPLGGTIRLWDELAQRLTPYLRVVAFDPRGAGASSPPRPWQSTCDMARDALAVLDHLAIERAHVFGLSLGGMVASWLAIDAPERIDHLILGSTLPSPAAVSSRAARLARDVARAFAAPGDEVEARIVRRVLSPRFRRLHPDRVADILRRVRLAPARRRDLLVHMVAAARHHLGERLCSSPLPMLLIFGGLDPVAAADARLALADQLPTARVEVILDAGHDLSLEAPDALADRVLDFLDLGAGGVARKLASDVVALW